MTNILTINELKNSVLNANIDDEYIQPAIDEAQSIYLREILGDALLNAVINKINGNNLTGKYLTLVNDYIKPYLSYMVQSIIVVPITYKIRNAGVVQQYDNGFTTSQMKDTQYLKDYYDGKAEFYGNRLTEYLKKNASDIIEYRLSASNVTNPTTSQNVTNIFLGGTKRGKCGGMIPSGGGTHDTVDWDDITNRPNFALVATSGDYNDLTNKPELFSGDYNDLSNKPEIPTVNNATLTITQGGTTKGTFTANAGTDVEINLDAGGSGSTDWDDIQNKPNFATVATSGDYSDLSNTPSLATVATSGDYRDLENTPTIPAAQVNADWNANSGVQQILNKPDLGDYVRVVDYNVQMQNIDNALADKVDVGTYNNKMSAVDNTLADKVDVGTYNNKMSAVDSALADKVETGNLCRINNERLDTNSNFELVRTDSIATLTITQGGTTKGTFTPNSGTDVTINLDAGGGGGGSTDWSDIQNKPNFATVATSGSYNDLSNRPSLATVATTGDYSDLSNTPSLATVATSGSYVDLSNKPSLATVATSGSYDDLTDKPTIPTVPTNVSAFTNDAGYTTFDGDYDSLTNKPTIPAAQINADWNASTGVQQILNKPTLATVATSGSYNDLSNKPSLATVATSGDYTDLSNTPSLATVATSGSYNDLSNKPTIPTVNNATLTIKQGGTTKGTFTANAGTDVEINLDAGGSGSTDWSDIQNKPTFATVATSGSYNDLSDKPTIPSAQVNADWNASTGVQQILNKPTLATVATTGSYSDLSNKPSLATVATSGSYADLSNTPSLATVATSGSYSDLSNKPTIPDDETDLGLTTETWTFTLQDSSTVTKQVVIKPTV